MEPIRLSLRLYVGAVIAGGTLALAAVAATTPFERLLSHNPLAWALVALLWLGELRPVRVPVGEEAQEVSTGTAFAFALLLLADLPLAAAAHAAVTLIVDLARGRIWWKVAFNAAQIVVTLVAANAVLTLTGAGGLHEGDVTALRVAGAIGAAAVYFVVNNALVCVAIALAEQRSLWRVLRADVGFQALTAGALLSLAPLLVVVTRVSPLLAPLFAPALVAVYFSMKLSVEKERQALHDALTGLPNRALFHDRIRTALTGASGSDLVAVLLIDLDYFKDVNDTLGHHVGDVLLRGVATRLLELVDGDTTVGRLGGDEFAVLLKTRSTDDVHRLAEAVRARLNEPFQLDDISFHIEASIGAAVAPLDADDAGLLVQRADVAMYTAKGARTGFERYSHERDQCSPKRLALLAELRTAIDDDQLVLHFQPKASVATGRVEGVEVLVRWEHPVHGLVMPDEFIPLAEPTGIITVLTAHVLERACEQWAAWRRLGLDLSVAVNISVRNLYDRDFPAQVATLLERHGMPAQRLDLELTENALMADPKRALACLRQLDVMGVRLTLDDFGTGYSSLGYLKRLPVGHVKIDKSFVMHMAWDQDDVAIVRSIINLAKSLNLTVTAEGVENATVIDQLSHLGCDSMQGYFLSRPLPGTKFLAWLLALGRDRLPLGSIEQGPAAIEHSVDA